MSSNRMLQLPPPHLRRLQRHIEQVLGDVPPDARCKCRETGASKGGSGGGG